MSFTCCWNVTWFSTCSVPGFHFYRRKCWEILFSEICGWGWKSCHWAATRFLELPLSHNQKWRPYLPTFPVQFTASWWLGPPALLLNHLFLQEDVTHSLVFFLIQASESITKKTFIICRKWQCMICAMSSLTGTLSSQEWEVGFQFLLQYKISMQYYFIKCFHCFAHLITIFILGETLELHRELIKLMEKYATWHTLQSHPRCEPAHHVRLACFNKIRKNQLYFPCVLKNIILKRTSEKYLRAHLVGYITKSRQ